MVILLPMLLLACEFSASTEVRLDDTGLVDDTGSPGGSGAGGGSGSGSGGSSGGDGGDSGGSGGGSGSGGDTGEEPDPSEVDDDGDGYAEVDGDCDDADATISPEATDGCDGVDEDCDGSVDEDAVDEDEYEPNDDAGYDLGSLDEDTDRSLSAALHNDEDVDRYEFSFTDSGWNLFTLRVGLSGLPDGAVYGLTVTHLETGEERHSELSSESQAVEISDTAFTDEGGAWELAVEAWTGADCGERYLLTVELD